MNDDEFMLTTVDNPFNPFTQFDDWFAFDEQKGYQTSEYLARVAHTSYDLSDADNKAAINEAINEIIDINILGIYRKYNQSNFEPIQDRVLSEEEKACLEIAGNNITNTI